MRKKDDIRCVLITRFSALGDVAMTIPTVYGACLANPGVHFVMLTRKLPAKLFVNPPANLTVKGIDTNQYPGVKGIFRLFRELRDEFGFTTLIDLHDVLRTKLLRLRARLAGIAVKSIRKGRCEKKALTRSNRKAMVPLKPTPERYRETFLRAGIPVGDSFPGIFPDGKPSPSLFADATPAKSDSERWIAVAPFAAHPGKVYPFANMTKVVENLAARDGWKIFIFGAGDKEAQQIDAMAGGRPNVVNMAKAKIGMTGELALMSHCDLMLAMDSANMHLASLVGLRTLSIWGATHPFTGFYGIGQDPADAIQLDMVCRPCSVFGNKPCARHDLHCLFGISPQMVVSRIDSIFPSGKNNTK